MSCRNCMERRCIFFWRIVDEDFNIQFDGIRSVIVNLLYRYQSGDNLCAFESNPLPYHESTNTFHAKNNLPFHMSVKKLYL